MSPCIFYANFSFRIGHKLLGLSVLYLLCNSALKKEKWKDRSNCFSCRISTYPKTKPIMQVKQCIACMRQRVELGSEIEITIVIPGLIKSEMTQEIPKPARQIGIR
ncbi:hypothetical protein BDE02_15G086700 [Populus trichocarpa]|nr:hypothetical protein BDE02_15G086700 [Populus trichocarpa]